MKVLVFGGTGAMGTPLVEKLVSQGHDVHVTSRKKRTSSQPNLHYIAGNAHDNTNMTKWLAESYDAIVDFMNYTTAEFAARAETLLRATSHYVFISTCRVYAESKTPITESSPRLLDVCDDKTFLATDEYALAKARQENILTASAHKNWTIVRPSVTYNTHRLQLGCYELEEWLYRWVHNRPILFFEDLMDKQTPMTHGNDVAETIACLLGNPSALGETLHIVSPETMTWGEILSVYRETFEEVCRYRPKIVMHPHAAPMENAVGRGWRLKYNRIYNRSFDSTKADFFRGGVKWRPMKTGLHDSLKEFLTGDRHFRNLPILNMAYMDKALHSHTPLSEFNSAKTKAKYLIARYTPYFAYKRMTNR